MASWIPTAPNRPKARTRTPPFDRMPIEFQNIICCRFAAAISDAVVPWGRSEAMSDDMG